MLSCGNPRLCACSAVEDPSRVPQLIETNVLPRAQRAARQGRSKPKWRWGPRWWVPSARRPCEAHSPGRGWSGSETWSIQQQPYLKGNIRILPKVPVFKLPQDPQWLQCGSPFYGSDSSTGPFANFSVLGTLVKANSPMVVPATLEKCSSRLRLLSWLGFHAKMVKEHHLQCACL